jgi:REP element-mobilizing transposase RayT
MGGHSYYVVWEHIAFSTKYREKLLDNAIQKELFPYLAASIRNQGCRCVIVGGHLDHVHLLVGKSGTLLTWQLVKEIKRTSSIWIKTKGPQFSGFRWQVGSGTFGVSYSMIEQVKKYIATQEKHHQEISWEDEYRLLLEKHGVEYDKRYYLD